MRLQLLSVDYELPTYKKCRILGLYCYINDNSKDRICLNNFRFLCISFSRF